MKKYSIDELDGLPAHRQQQLTNKDKAEDIARSQFWPDIAKDHGIRLAALVFKVAAKTHKKHRERKVGHKAGWAAPASQWAEWIGLTERKQVYRLLRQAQKSRLLNWRKTGVGTLVWLHKTSLYNRIKVDEHGRFISYGDTKYYNHHHGLSLAAGMILDSIAHYSLSQEYFMQLPMEPEGVRRNAEGWRLRFPFLTIQSIKKALHTLRKLELADTDEEDFWWLNVKVYTKFIAQKAGDSRGDTQIPEGTMEIPQGTMQIPEGTTKSAYQQHSNNGTPATLAGARSPLANARRAPISSPPTADDELGCFASFLEEDSQAQAKMDKGWKTPVDVQEAEEITPAGKQEEESIIKDMKISSYYQQEEVRRSRKKKLIKQHELNKARDREEQKQKRKQEAKASVLSPADKPKRLANYDRFLNKQEQAEISPDVLRAIEARLRMEEEKWSQHGRVSPVLNTHDDDSEGYTDQGGY